MLSNEQGASRFKVFFWVALLFLVVHVLLKVIPMYMDFYRLEDEMKMKAGAAGQGLKDDEILRDLEKKAKEGEIRFIENKRFAGSEPRHDISWKNATEELHFLLLDSLKKKAKEVDLPLTQDSFIISRSEDGHITNIVTKGGWDVEVNFLFGAYIREFHFEPTAVE